MPAVTELAFDVTALDDLDEFALLARQDCNLGGRDEWFGEFRGGFHGVHARLYGLTDQYRLAHCWIPAVRSPAEMDYRVASMFFAMDSAIECFTYMLNALGCVARPADFRQVCDPRALREISPADILAKPGDTPPKVSGYGQVFPNLQRHWQANQTLISAIVEQHDVSKHRRTTYVGGQGQNCPPAGFYERCGVPAHYAHKALFHPPLDIVVRRDPKLPTALRTPNPAQDRRMVLEKIVENFRLFFDRSCVLARDDARANIMLPHIQFEGVH